jgi:hypothetical protein
MVLVSPTKIAKVARILTVIVLICLALLIVVEFIARAVAVQDEYLKNLPFLHSDIKGVPYLQVNFSLFAKEKAKPRILVMGDYVSIHKSVQGGKDYPQLVSERLNYRYEIINTAATLYSIPEELAVLKSKGLDLNPDWIIIGYVFNDIDLSHTRRGADMLTVKEGIFKFRIISHRLFKYKQYMSRLSNLSKLYYNKSEIVNAYYDKYKTPYYASVYKNYLTELSNISRTRKIPVIFVVIPIFYNFNDTRLNEINAFLYDECVEHGLRCINMLETFKMYQVNEVKEEDNDIWHPNALGIELIAEQITKAMDSR